MTTKKYSVNLENDEVVSIEVDGVPYASLDEIPDEQDRQKVERLISMPAGDGGDDGVGDAGELFDREEFEREFQALERQTAHLPKLIAAIFLGVAALLLVIAAISAVNAVRRQAREQGVPGQVVDLVTRRSRDSETGEMNVYAYPVVEYAPPGQPVQTVQLSEGSWPPAYTAGDRVTILYDPQQPRDARIQSPASSLLLWLLPGITGLVGVSFAAAALFVFRMWPARRDEAAPA